MLEMKILDIVRLGSPLQLWRRYTGEAAEQRRPGAAARLILLEMN